MHRSYLFAFPVMLLATAALQAQKYYLFAGAFTKSGENGITIYKFNARNGDLQQVSEFDVPNASYMAISEDNRFVYSVNRHEDKKGEVAAFAFDHATGMLQLLNAQPSHGADPCYVSIDRTNHWVVVGNYTGANFAVYPLNSKGELEEAVQVIQHTGDATHTTPHVHSVVFSPDNKYLAVTDLGLDKIMVYRFHENEKKPIDEHPVAVNADPGSGPRHILFHPTLPFAYVLGEISGKVTVYTYQGDTFRQLQIISGLPQGYHGNIGSAAIRMSKDGKFLYTSNRGDAHSIAIFSIEASSGMLRLQGIHDSGGKIPRDFNLDPTGKFLLCANQDSGNITVFKRNRKTGLFTYASKQLQAGKPVFLGFMAMK